MKEKIEIFNEEKKSLKKEVKGYVKDKKIPLEERWNVFILSELGDHSSYYEEPKGINWNKYTLYDDFHTDKYAVLKVDDMLETAIENDIIKQGSKEEIDFKEYFLSKFIYSFENDW